MSATGANRALALRIALQHFRFQHVPDCFVQFDKARQHPDLGNVARPRQVDRELADRMRRGPRRQHDDAIRQRDRLLQVVRDEQDGLAVGRPQVEQLVLHQLTCLDVERRERLVHQQDLGIEDQHLGQRHALAHAAGKLMRIAVLETGEADARQPFVARRTASARATPRNSSPAVTLSSALRHGISASVWNM